MTNRLDNMERRGLIRRLDDPDDRRGVIVELTDEGKKLWEQAVGAQAEKESIVASALDEREKRQLNDLLRPPDERVRGAPRAAQAQGEHRRPGS